MQTLQWSSTRIKCHSTVVSLLVLWAFLCAGCQDRLWRIEAMNGAAVELRGVTVRSKEHPHARDIDIGRLSKDYDVASWTVPSSFFDGTKPSVLEVCFEIAETGEGKTVVVTIPEDVRYAIWRNGRYLQLIIDKDFSVSVHCR